MSWPCSEAHSLELHTTLVARRTASAASISSWEFKLGWLDSSNTVAVVSHKAEYDAVDVGEPC